MTRPVGAPQRQQPRLGKQLSSNCAGVTPTLEAVKVEAMIAMMQRGEAI
jgi:hypothetical protein